MLNIFHTWTPGEPQELFPDRNRNYINASPILSLAITQSLTRYVSISQPVFRQGLDSPILNLLCRIQSQVLTGPGKYLGKSSHSWVYGV